MRCARGFASRSTSRQRVADEHHGVWYRALWAPSVTAGLITLADLAGYRTGPIYIRRSTHVPPPHEAVLDLVPAFFECLGEEDDPAVRVALGHFVFVYIHPYMDGNGRIGRFLMNVMLAAMMWSYFTRSSRKPEEHPRRIST
jgi:hypothetical protein